MDPFVIVGVAVGFTVFGYVWGRGSEPNRTQIERIVSKTCDSLEQQGYLRSEIIKGELCYVKWPRNHTEDL